MERLNRGMKVRHAHQTGWGVGHVLDVEDDGLRVRVAFPGRAEAVLLSTRSGELGRVELAPGQRMRLDGAEVTVVGPRRARRGIRRYLVRRPDGSEAEFSEARLRAPPPASGVLEALVEGTGGEARAFRLRREVLRLDEERRADALGALFASRVMVRPHQVGVVQRVLSAPRPRFVLADEVGLGKTIEAGMIFSALRLSGLARRVLVVAPSHLTVQWLVELFHKFNQLFTLLDGARYAAERERVPDVSPWARFDLVITSLELLSRGERHLAEVTDPAAAWDLVVFDEAHHLKAPRAMEVARRLSDNAYGLLLATATPLQLDPEEYRRLLALLDPEAAPTPEAFAARLARQETVSAAVRAILEGGDVEAARRELVQVFPDDPVLAAADAPADLLSHLAETYSLSDRLVRNRRAVVGGFAERRLHRHRVEVPDAVRRARAEAVEAVRAGGGAAGAVLAGLLRRLESSPAAFREALDRSRDLAGLAGRLELPDADPRLPALVRLLETLDGGEPGAKVLLFTESRATLDWLEARLGQAGVEALGYHGDLSLVERDRRVARFRDPEGPRVLLSTELGGEGRNFQFAHHLVCWDLPWSPAAMEQRIGRLDRIGQRHPVDVHVFELPGTLSADVLHLLDDAVDVFGQTVGGLDAVLEEVEPRLVELALAPPEARAAYAEELAARVRSARAQVRRAYDPLLDLRSFDRPAVEALVDRAVIRFGLDEELDDASLEDALEAVSRDLDERLEDGVTELARRIGVTVDTETGVEAFQCALHFGHELLVEALPGIDLREERTVVGTFWRDTAVEQEEIEYLATGHPVIESLFAFLRDGPYGRTAFRLVPTRGPRRGRGLEVLVHLQAPEPEDTSPGARVPSRHLARFVDRWLVHVAVLRQEDGSPKVDASLLPCLDRAGRTLRGDAVRAAFPDLARFVPQAWAAALAAAEAEAGRIADRARRAIHEERDARLERLERSLVHQGVDDAGRAVRLEETRAHYARLEAALDGLTVGVDSAAAFVLTPDETRT